MVKQVIEIGTAPAGQDGDTNREASIKINSNFTELYVAISNVVRGPSMAIGGEVAVFSGTTGKDIVGGGIKGGANGFASLNASAKVPMVQIQTGANGVATLGADGKLPAAQLPPLAVNEVFTVASQAAMLALTAERGDVAVRSDQAGKTYILSQDDPTTLANWVPLQQALSAALAALNALTPAADRIPFFTGPSSADLLPINTIGKALIAVADAAAARATISAAKSGANSDITSLTALTTPLSVSQGGTGADTAPAARAALGIPGKNLIINGDFQLNQRGYGGGGAATAGLYTYDRWQVVVAGQSAPSAASPTGPGSIVTAPAGGIMQPVEAGMISAGVYSLSWTGTATAIITQDNNPLVQSQPVVKGGQVTLIANQVARVLLRSGTVGDVQLEAGPVSTPFERLHVGYVTQLCQRYFEVIECAMLGYGLTNQLVGAAFGYKVRKRATPTATLYRDGTLITNVNAATLGQQVYADQIIVYRNVTSTGEIRWHEGYYISAEIA